MDELGVRTDDAVGDVRPVAEREARAQLARVLGSQCFANAPSLSRLLSHIVECTLAGRSDQLKEYALGVDVFDRGEEFDPRTDTIVRVQARRLRAKIQEYFASEGRHDSIVIELSKGHYVPEFRRRESFQRRGGRELKLLRPSDWNAGPGSLRGERPAETRPVAISRKLLIGLATAVAAIGILGGVWQWSASRDRPVTLSSEYVQVTDFTDSATAPALSPDGRMVAFIRGGEPFLSRGQIYVQMLPHGDAVRITNSPGLKFAPTFAPDGNRVAYTEVSGIEWNTWTVPVLGGPATRLLPNASGLSWLDDQHVIFSELKGKGPHMGIVTATESRSEERDIYLPAHERGMAHYSYASPDRSAAIVAEMDRTGTFQSCRLVPFDGRSPGRLVGPIGHCRSAAWSPDGTWMYFSVDVAGHSHLWREAYPRGSPEQITFGPTEEEGVAIGPDGRWLMTSIGTRRSTIWIHDRAGERQVPMEGFAYAPRLSRNGGRVYYLFRSTPDAVSSELRTIDLMTGAIERILPGIAVVETDIWSSNYDISEDEKEVVFASKGTDGETSISIAPLDRRTPPRVIARDAEYVTFGGHDDVFFVTLGDRTSYFTRIRKDGSGRERISDVSPVVNRSGVSPNGEWAVLYTGPGGTIAVPTHGGTARKLCESLCWVWWSDDARHLYVSTYTPVERTLVIPLQSGDALPHFTDAGLDQATIPGTVTIDRTRLQPGPDPSTYVFVRIDVQRNLYRIKLH